MIPKLYKLSTCTFKNQIATTIINTGDFVI